MKHLKIGEPVIFKGIDLHSHDYTTEKLDKPTVISIFPKINTEVCDVQTITLGKLANKYPNINFVAFSMDDVEDLHAWCLSHNVENNNLFVVTDKKYNDFGTQFDYYADYKGMKLLDRSVLLLDKHSKLLYIERKNGNHSEQIKFDLLEKELDKLSK